MDQYLTAPLNVTGTVGFTTGTVGGNGLFASEGTLNKLLSQALTSGSVFVFAAISGTSVQSQFSGSVYSGLRTAISGASVFTMKAEGDIFYRFATTATGEVVDPNETTGSNQCGIIFAGEREDIVLPVGTQSIITRGATNNKLRLWKSS